MPTAGFIEASARIKKLIEPAIEDGINLAKKCNISRLLLVVLHLGDEVSEQRERMARDASTDFIEKSEFDRLADKLDEMLEKFRAEVSTALISPPCNCALPRG